VLGPSISLVVLVSLLVALLLLSARATIDDEPPRNRWYKTVGAAPGCPRAIAADRRLQRRLVLLLHSAWLVMLVMVL
jgi:hypothetical protein